MFFSPWTSAGQWAFPIALLGAISYSPAFAYGITVARFDFPMVVVEPTIRPIQGTMMATATLSAERISGGLPNHKFKNGELTQQEVSRALILRMDTQRALRNLRARRLALHRHQGIKAWRREMELYLAAQRQLKANMPQVKPPAGSNSIRPAPDGRAPRKSNSVMA